MVKLYNGVEGNLILFNEYVCYRLARLLAIDMPISGICLYDAKTEVYNSNVSEQNQGYAFYSSYYPKVTVLNRSIISLMKNAEDIYKIVLFDHIIFNTDRNLGNLLVQFYKSDISLKVIDHTHVFINQAIWEAHCLNDGMQDKDYFSTKIMEYNEGLYSMFFERMSWKKELFEKQISLFREKINCDIIEEIISEIPETWLPCEADRLALEQYILYRVEHLEDICVTIQRYFESR